MTYYCIVLPLTIRYLIHKCCFLVPNRLSVLQNGGKEKPEVNDKNTSFGTLDWFSFLQRPIVFPVANYVWNRNLLVRIDISINN